MAEKPKFQLPGVGLRNLKTAFSAALCAALYFLIGRNPTFACIGAVYGMGSDMGDSWKQGGNRLIGTVIGGFLGMALFWLYRVLDPSGETRALLVPLLALGVVVLIVLAQIFQWPTAVQPGSVVLCIILFNTPVDTYVSYAPAWASSSPCSSTTCSPGSGWSPGWKSYGAAPVGSRAVRAELSHTNAAEAKASAAFSGPTGTKRSPPNRCAAGRRGPGATAGRRRPPRTMPSPGPEPVRR